MRTIANELHFKVAVITFKGLFRFAIKLALKEKNILNNSLAQPKKIGLAEQQIVVLFDKL